MPVSVRIQLPDGDARAVVAPVAVIGDRKCAPSEIVILPLTWCEPDAVAMNTLMAPWLIAYYSDAVFRGSWPDPQFHPVVFDWMNEQ